jgi:hypothetical protein
MKVLGPMADISSRSLPPTGLQCADSVAGRAQPTTQTLCSWDWLAVVLIQQEWKAVRNAGLSGARRRAVLTAQLMARYQQQLRKQTPKPAESTTLGKVAAVMRR